MRVCYACFILLLAQGIAERSEQRVVHRHTRNGPEKPAEKDPCKGQFIPNALKCFKIKELTMCGMASPAYKQQCGNATAVIHRAYDIAVSDHNVAGVDPKVAYVTFHKGQADEFETAAKQAGFDDFTLISVKDFTPPGLAQMQKFVDFVLNASKNTLGCPLLGWHGSHRHILDCPCR